MHLTLYVGSEKSGGTTTANISRRRLVCVRRGVKAVSEKNEKFTAMLSIGYQYKAKVNGYPVVLWALLSYLILIT